MCDAHPMRLLGFALSAGIALVACSSDSTNGTGSACTDVVGNYSITVERVSGTCDPAIDPKTATASLVKNGDDYAIVLPSIPGGCPATLDTATCKLSSACEFKDKNGEIVGNMTVSYTLTATGYTGTSVNGLRPPAVAAPCDVTYRETGKKL